MTASRSQSQIGTDRSLSQREVRQGTIRRTTTDRFTIVTETSRGRVDYHERILGNTVETLGSATSVGEHGVGEHASVSVVILSHNNAARYGGAEWVTELLN